MLPFWLSIALLSLVQGGVVAIPGSAGAPKLARLRGRRWALIPPVSVLAVGLAVFALATLWRRRAAPAEGPSEEPELPREQWTMPPLALLGRPRWSTGRKIAMLTLRGYLLVSVILLIVKAVQLGGG